MTFARIACEALSTLDKPCSPPHNAPWSARMPRVVMLGLVLIEHERTGSACWSRIPGVPRDGSSHGPRVTSPLPVGIA